MGFQEDLERGKYGERLFKKWLAREGISYQDISDNESYWKQDIDILADGVRYEIKTDYKARETGNLVVEHKARYHDGHIRPGWLHISQADYIVYVVPPKEGQIPQQKCTFYFVKLENLKRLIEWEQPRLAICFESYKETDIYLVKPENYPDVFYRIDYWEF